MSFWLKLGSLAALIAVAIGWHVLDKRNAVQSSVEAQRAMYTSLIQQEVIRAQETSTSLLTSALKDLQTKEDEIKDINNKLSNALRRLQQRPSREDSSSDSRNSLSCTGAELLREDGEFLAREAARADRILKERDFYYEQYERARKALASH